MKDNNSSPHLDQHCFLVTLHCCRHQHFLSAGNSMQVLSDNLLFINTRYGTELFGYVFLPNFISMILYLQEARDLENYIRELKKSTSLTLRREVEVFHPEAFDRSKNPASKHRFDIWSPGSVLQNIASEWNLLETLDDLHQQPSNQQWQLSRLPEEYLYSSANFYSGHPENIWMPVTHYLESFRMLQH